MKKKVIVGLSGGVDSAVAAYLLKEQGYEVIGVTMQMWREERPDIAADMGMTARDVPVQNMTFRDAAARDAAAVAETLGIPHMVVDFRKEFKQQVVDYFIDEYLNARTPNPCVICNRYVKWEALLKKGEELGADYIATGHYARIEQLPNGRFSVRNSVTAAKDQTYALYHLTQEQLKRTLMPVGEYSKDRIREIAKEQHLPVAQKADSQDICFIPDQDYAAFLERNAPERMPGPGNFVTPDGRILGTHKGITHYTIGQRRGLEIAAGHRIFVSEIRPETNEVVIGENEDIFTDKVWCDRVNLMSVASLEEPVRVLGRIRYAHKGEYCRISREADGRVLCRFEKPIRAATPGQAVVFYDGEYVLGGGTIL